MLWLRTVTLLIPHSPLLLRSVCSVWANLLDSTNKYEFLCANLDFEERHQLAHAMSFEKFKFNWENPTGHWRLDLSNRAQRGVMNQLGALSMVERDFSENMSRRGDTSQKVSLPSPA